MHYPLHSTYYKPHATRRVCPQSFHIHAPGLAGRCEEKEEHLKNIAFGAPRRLLPFFNFSKTPNSFTKFRLAVLKRVRIFDKISKSPFLGFKTYVDMPSRPSSGRPGRRNGNGQLRLYSPAGAWEHFRLRPGRVHRAAGSDSKFALAAPKHLGIAYK